jgi:hypothetical protein
MPISHVHAKGKGDTTDRMAHRANGFQAGQECMQAHKRFPSCLHWLHDGTPENDTPAPTAIAGADAELRHRRVWAPLALTDCAATQQGKGACCPVHVCSSHGRASPNEKRTAMAVHPGNETTPRFEARAQEHGAGRGYDVAPRHASSASACRKSRPGVGGRAAPGVQGRSSALPWHRAPEVGGVDGERVRDVGEAQLYLVRRDDPSVDDKGGVRTMHGWTTQPDSVRAVEATHGIDSCGLAL